MAAAKAPVDVLIMGSLAGDYGEAARVLNVIKYDHSRLDAVLALQRYLIRSIASCERRIQRLRRGRARLKRKLARERLSRSESRLSKALIARIDQRIKEVHHQIFLWRCFGDGIAFNYQSKYSLKHLFYDRDYVPKQGPGFISGKQGFRKEYRFLRMGIRMNVPVVMADLTNVIRHGDLCALAGSDPLPVEFKSSGNGNARMRRQVADLDEIASFYANDGAEIFRGVPNTVRVELAHTEVRYEAEMNSCIAAALHVGHSITEPEEGLRYIAYTREFAESNGEQLNRLISAGTRPAQIYTLLTPDLTWLPLHPFTLSLSEGNLIPFIERRMEMVVLLDVEVLKRKFAELGVHAIVVMDSVHALQICIDPGDLMKGVFRLSVQRFTRISCEFQSLDWFAKECASAFGGEPSIAGEAVILTEEYRRILDEWRVAKCLFANVT